jgi:hypothetical protein
MQHSRQQRQVLVTSQHLSMLYLPSCKCILRFHVSYVPFVCNLQSKGIRWAMAGRNRAKLEEVKQQLTKIDPACAVRALSLVV